MQVSPSSDDSSCPPLLNSGRLLCHSFLPALVLVQKIIKAVRASAAVCLVRGHIKTPKRKKIKCFITGPKVSLFSVVLMCCSSCSISLPFCYEKFAIFRTNLLEMNIVLTNSVAQHFSTKISIFREMKYQTAEYWLKGLSPKLPQAST